MAISEDSVERVFREESGRILAGLIRLLGDFDQAEDALQDVFARALERWPADGVPANPAAWITTAARRRAIDLLRRRRTRREDRVADADDTVPQGAGAPMDRSADPSEEMRDSLFPDDRLRLIFTCCHPALNRPAQVALTLRLLGGLGTPEIARAFLVPPATLGQRLVRAKAKIREAGIPYIVPGPESIDARLPGVLAVLYLIFNEGYSATAGDDLIRADLCAEAIRLGRILAELMPREGEVLGLVALMLLQDSRRPARRSSAGEIILLEDQDRTAWDRKAIEEGDAFLERALAAGRPGAYRIQAAIAAAHAAAGRAGETDWRRIVSLYDALMAIAPSPVVALNRAVAVAMADGPKRGLALIDRIGESGALEGYLYFHAARADLLRRLDRREESRITYRRALLLAGGAPERRFLERRLASLDPR